MPCVTFYIPKADAQTVSNEIECAWQSVNKESDGLASPAGVTAVRGCSSAICPTATQLPVCSPHSRRRLSRNSSASENRACMLLIRSAALP